MFELYKKRDLNANFSDTTTFFKTFGRHYFKNYFIINGIFLMILIVLIYLISKIYMEALFSNVGGLNSNPNFLFSFFNENIFLFVGGFVLIFALVLILSMLNISYPVIYLKLFEKSLATDFSTKEIVTELKENIGKMIVFYFGFLFVILPLALVAFIILFLLCFILIGIPLLIIAVVALVSWLTLSYYDFILNKTGFFEALRHGFRLMKQKFWTTVGTSFLFMLLVQTIQGFITMIPYPVGMLGFFVSSKNLEDTSYQQNSLSTMGIVMVVVMVLSILLGYIFNNFIIVNQGIIYYSLQDEKENNSVKNQIDLIGTEIE